MSVIRFPLPTNAQLLHIQVKLSGWLHRGNGTLTAYVFPRQGQVQLIDFDSKYYLAVAAPDYLALIDRSGKIMARSADGLNQRPWYSRLGIGRLSRLRLIGQAVLAALYPDHFRAVHGLTADITPLDIRINPFLPAE